MNAYKLVDKQPVRIPEGALDDLEKAWQIENRRVAADVIGHVAVSTVFLVYDYAPGGSAPILFETMVFGSSNRSYDQYQERYHTWEAAEAGHARVVEALRHEQDDADILPTSPTALHNLPQPPTPD